MLRHVRKALCIGGLLFLVPRALPETACFPAERKEVAFFFQIRPALEILGILPVIGVRGKQLFHIRPRRYRQLRLPVGRRRTVCIREKSICSAQGKIQILSYPFRTSLAFFLQEAAKFCQDFRVVLHLQKNRVADNGQPATLFPFFP